MRKLLFACALVCAPLAACTTTGGLAPPPAPATVANATILDEQVGQGVELAYAAFRTALEFAVDTGRLKGAAATRAAALDNRAFAATQAVQAAYRAGNSAGYLAAAKEARAAIAAALAAIKGS